MADNNDDKIWRLLGKAYRPRHNSAQAKAYIKKIISESHKIEQDSPEIVRKKIIAAPSFFVNFRRLFQAPRRIWLAAPAIACVFLAFFSWYFAWQNQSQGKSETELLTLLNSEPQKYLAKVESKFVADNPILSAENESDAQENWFADLRVQSQLASLNAQDLREEHFSYVVNH